MHHFALNVTDIMVKLFRGNFRHDKADDPKDWTWACFYDDEMWLEHGVLVEEASRYIPGSFGRCPRNIAKKMNSGYKAWEFMYYFYGYLPGLLWAVMDPEYYEHYCKLVSGARFGLLVEQPLALRPYIHQLLVEFAEDFEEKYYARRPDRLHFCRHSIHLLTHIVPECIRLGPAWLNSQWPLETAIGNLTREIGSHRFPHANLSERCTRRCQICALYNIYPELTEPDRLPKDAVVLGDGYALLAWARDTAARKLPREGPEAAALDAYLRANNIPVPEHWNPAVWKWARLLLPNGQIARTGFRECKGERRGKPVHRARMVKVSGLREHPDLDVVTHRDVTLLQLRGDTFAEVLYFFPIEVKLADGTVEERTLAMLSDFTPPDRDIAALTHGALLACRYQGQNALRVIDAKEVQSIVGMVPLPARTAEKVHPQFAALFADRFFVVEKLGFDMTWIGKVDNVYARDDETGGD
ncbi:hypothetical protein C8T65DRAFT_578151 [Cerioporus squamosus]|nr:hypothetical protein C8T65DRAFT_578120 [Cerioporus squamosus]KAI0704483.1 hypothetical protein C8T65DRAFT_578151 [Cerioporus squamosus]